MRPVRPPGGAHALEQLSLARQIASIILSASVSSKTSKQDRGEQVIRTAADCAIWRVE